MSSGGWAAIPLLGVGLGILGGLLMANASRHKDEQSSPWPYIVGIVGLGLLAVIAGIAAS